MGLGFEALDQTLEQSHPLVRRQTQYFSLYCLRAGTLLMKISQCVTRRRDCAEPRGEVLRAGGQSRGPHSAEKLDAVPHLKAVAASLDVRQEKPHGVPAGLTPEEIFCHAYSVCHSPCCRSRYFEFPKGDFP